jgi:hypothetical protein
MYPRPPRERLDPEHLFSRPLIWRADPAHRLWFTAEVDGAPVFMRMNPTFPDDPLYSLLVAEDETLDFDDLPKTWRREGPLECADDE